MPAASYDLKQFEKNKASLFTDVESLPSLACRRRFLDAMMVQRELKKGESEFAKRVEPLDQARLVRDRLFLLKMCVVNKKDSDEPFLYSLH